MAPNNTTLSLADCLTFRAPEECHYLRHRHQEFEYLAPHDEVAVRVEGIDDTQRHDDSKSHEEGRGISRLVSLLALPLCGLLPRKNDEFVYYARHARAEERAQGQSLSRKSVALHIV